MAGALTPPVMMFLGRHLQGFSTYGSSVLANVVIYEISLCAVTGVFFWALGGRFTSVLTLAPMRWLARISYTFYLVHEGMLELAGRYVHHTGAIALFAAVASLLFAELSWRLMERPILHGGRRKVARRELAAAEPQHGSREAAASLDSL